MSNGKPGGGKKMIAQNRKARHDYHLETKYEAGVVLLGTEIKAIRASLIQLRDSHVANIDGELWLMNAHINAYQHASENHEPMRPRKLLLTRREIDKILRKIKEPGYTVIPTQVYLQRGLAKVEIAVAHGKKQHDKRQAIAKRDADRRIQREMGRRG